MKHRSSLGKCSALCMTCGREWFGKAEMGPAQNHAKLTGHRLRVERVQVVTFNPTAPVGIDAAWERHEGARR